MDESADSVTAIVSVNSIVSSSSSDLVSPVATVTVLAADAQILPTKAVATRKSRRGKTRQPAKSITILAPVTPVATEMVTPEPSSPQLAFGSGNLDASGTE